MRPYLAIIKDSFREAMSSWVLWIVLGFITVFLLVVAPFGLREELTTKFFGHELRDPPAFVLMLKAASENEESSPAKRIWVNMGKETQEELVKLRTALEQSEPGDSYIRLMGVLARELNRMLEKDDLYSPDGWKGVRLSDEAQKLVDKGRESLDNDERMRMNRLLIESAFPGQFLPQPVNSVVGTYLFWDTPAFPIQQSSIRSLLEEFVLSYFLSYIVGSGGVLVAVLVTANIIPQMFDPGSLHLLLSKPVNRTVLFLSKFVGGCAFTLLFAGYLLVGLWLILGLRFGIWNVGLLYCIPVFLFLFSIYYTISALTSVIWRNAIVSVIITIVFWGFCFVLGFVKVNVCDRGWLQPRRFVEIVPAGDAMLALDETGRVYQWNANALEWNEVFQGPGRVSPMYVGPLFDAKQNELVGTTIYNDGLIQIPVQLAIGKPGEGFRRQPGVGLPSGALDMFLEPERNRKESEKDQPGILIVSTNGIFRLANVPPRKILGVEVGFGSGLQFLKVAEDAELFFNTPAAAALNAETGELAVYSRGTVQVFAANAEGKYVLKNRVTLEVDEDKGAIVAFAGPLLLIAREDGKVQMLDPKTLLVDADLRGERRSQPRFVSAAPGGKLAAIVYQNGKLWLFDTETKSMRRASAPGQGDIYAATFKSSNRLLVGDRTMRVSEYAADTMKLQTRYAPTMSTVEKVYRYALSPLYFVTPRPGEVGYTMQYALTGKESSTSLTTNMQAARDSLNPWRPIWSGLIFMVVMLGLACVYIERQEF